MIAIVKKLPLERLRLKSFQRAGTVYIYSGALALIACVIATIVAFSLKQPAYPLFRNLQLVSFLLAGISHAYLISKSHAENGSEQRLKFSVLLSVVLFIILSIICMTMGTSQFMLAAGSSALFLLPRLLLEQWKQFAAIFQPRIPTWCIPNVSVRKNKATIYLNSMRVSIKITCRENEETPVIIAMVMPPRATLGKLFVESIEEFNKRGDRRIEVTDREGNPYTWSFFQEGAMGMILRIFNPEASLLQNKVQDNATITIQRSTTEFPVNSLKSLKHVTTKY